MSFLPASYGPLLRTPGVGRALGTSLLGRIGQPAAGLAVILLAVDRTGSYASGGAVSASWVIGAGIGSVLWSRLVDRGHGARRVLLGTALLGAAGLAALVLVRSGSTPVLAGLTTLAALFTAPVTPVSRALWPILLPEADARAAMYSLEATLQELVFIVGPSLAGLVAALVSPAAAVLAAGAAAVVGVVVFSVSPGLERLDGGERQPVRAAALRPLVPLFAVAFLLCGLSFVEVGVIGAAGAAGAAAAAGALLAVWSAGSLVGGLIGGARPARRGPGRRLIGLLVATAAGHAALAAYPGLVGLGALLVLVGALVAPALAGIYTLVEVSAPAGAVTQTFAGLAVALLGGSAAGSALAGVVVQGHGSGPAFLLGAIPPALAAVLTRLTIGRRVAGSAAVAADPRAG